MDNADGDNALKRAHSRQEAVPIAAVSILLLMTGCEQAGQVYRYFSSGPVWLEDQTRSMEQRMYRNQYSYGFRIG